MHISCLSEILAPWILFHGLKLKEKHAIELKFFALVYSNKANLGLFAQLLKLPFITN